jgi:hypothetical protein
VPRPFLSNVTANAIWNNYRIILACFLLTLISGCSGGRMEGESQAFNSLKDIPQTAWEKLAQKSIYFGHQSVGENIVDGMRELMKDYPQVKFNINETGDGAGLKKNAFTHSRIGKNTDPEGKSSDFLRILDSGIGGLSDIAFYKFCYVDFDGNTNIERVFNTYKATREAVRQKYPHLTVVHCTTPLTTVPTGWKVSLKKMLGMTIDGYVENIRRNLFNEKLWAEYGGKEPIYDLAGIESLTGDGANTVFAGDGKTYYSMDPEKTDDGGHLNRTGRRMAAEQLLVLLAKLSQ